MRTAAALSLLLTTAAFAPAIFAQGQPAPQTVPNPPRDTSAAVARYVKVPAAEWIVLEHVRVIDGTGRPPLEDTTLVLHSGRIVSVGSVDATVPADAVKLDLSGDTVFPGLVGMHDHMYYIARPNLDAEGRSEPPLVVPQMTFTSPHLYLGAGVTTLRTTGSVEPYTDLNLKREIDAGHIPGPHMDVTAPYLEGPRSPFIQMHQLRDEADARATVDFWAAQGATSFKAYMNITRAELGAAIQEAHKLGLKVTGHLCSVTYPEAVALGIEVELLVDAGFTPLEAIKIATLNGAQYLGRDREIGSVAVGKNADLVIVKGNPAERISDIENTVLVFAVQEPSPVSVEADVEQKAGLGIQPTSDAMQDTRPIVDANDRIRVIPPTEKMTMLEPSKLQVSISVPGITKLQWTQAVRGRDGKFHDIDKNVSDADILTDSSGNRYILVTPSRLGSIAFDIVGQYPDGAVVMQTVHAEVRPSRMKPDALIVGQRGDPTGQFSTVRSYLDESSPNFLVISAKYRGTADQQRIDPNFVQFYVRSADSKPVLGVDQNTGRLKGLAVGDALVEVTYGGQKKLVCVVVDQKEGHATSSADCRELLLPGESLK